jgi:hypothetical protein
MRCEISEVIFRVLLASSAGIRLGIIFEDCDPARHQILSLAESR